MQGSAAPSADTSPVGGSTDYTPPVDTSNSSSASSTGVSEGAHVNTPPIGAPTNATVTYTANGFSPATVTIAKGGTVAFVDQSGAPMYVASDPHPNHNGYDGNSRATHCAPGYSGAKPLDQCAPGSSFSFTFTKTGSWGYHNHVNEADGGTIVVQ